MRVRVPWWCSVGVLLAAPAAAEPEGAVRAVPPQVMGGHNFQYPVLQRPAFVTTRVGFVQGIELITDSEFNIGSREFDVDAFGVAEQLEFGVQFLERLELYGRANANAYSGQDVASMLGGGAGYAYGGSLGLGAAVFRASSTTLVVRAEGGAGTAERLELLRFAGALLESPVATVEAVIDGQAGEFIISSATRSGGYAGLQLAQALGPALGVQVGGGVAVADLTAEFFEREESTRLERSFTLLSPEVAAAVGLDLLPLSDVLPIALLGEYSATFTNVRNDETDTSDWVDPIHVLGAGVYYSGRPELQFGAMFSQVLELELPAGVDARGRVSPPGSPSVSTIHLSLRYTW